jgi:thiamine-phosphate pyrophosphorylase
MAFSLQGYYAILDVKGSSVEFPAVVAHATRLLDAGPCCLQLRGKDLGPAALCGLGHALRPLCERSAVPLCINDRLDVALAVGAQAVHLGQGDLPVAQAVRACKAASRRLAIGVSIHDLAEARAADTDGADYLGFGPVFPTKSKADARLTAGLAALAEVAAAVRLPIVAIGGIGLDSVVAVAAAGASAAAAIAAVDEAPDPTVAGRTLAAAFRFSRPART